MSSRRLRVPLVALVAIAVVAVGIVFFVLRRGSQSGLVYEGEIPVVDKDEIRLYTAEVSTVSLPIKADYAGLASKIRDAAMKSIKQPVAQDKYTVSEVGGRILGANLTSSLIFYYTADLLSLDVSLHSLDVSLHSLSSLRMFLPSHRLRRPRLSLKGEIHLHGPIQHKAGGKYISTPARYDGKFQFTRLYIAGLDGSANLILEELGHGTLEPLERAKLKVVGIPFEDWFGGLKKAVLPVLEDEVDKALEENVESDYLTPFYDKGWVALHNPIKLTSGVWLVFHPEEFKVAQLCCSGTTLETTIAVRGRPTVILGDKPQVPQVPPRPPVRLGETAGGVHVVVDAIVPLDEAERLLNKELRGLEKVIYNQANVKVKVPKARIYSCENCLRLELLLTKPFKGSVFLEGAPRYDAEMNELYVEGLDFTVDTRNVLAKSAGWLLDFPPLMDYLQTKVRLPVGGQLADVGKAISKYSTEFPDYGVVIQGETTSFTVLGVYNTREAMHLIVQADGSAEVTMN